MWGKGGVLKKLTLVFKILQTFMLESVRVPGNNPINAHIATVPNDSLSASTSLLFHIK